MNGQPAAMAGATLCATKFRGKLSDERAGPDRNTFPHPGVVDGPRAQVHGNDLAVVSPCLLGRDSERVDQAGDLSASISDWLARLDAKCLRELSGTLLEAGSAMGEDRAPTMRWQPRHGSSGAFGKIDRALDGCGIGEGNSRYCLVGVLVGDGKSVAGVVWGASEVVRVTLGEHHRLLRRNPPMNQAQTHHEHECHRSMA